ncbi:hypothetical protein LC1Hm_1657 [Halomicrobium sp. LC1Hm]|nr:hypothetical protein LC1Hm_1657 [Halomicrobium sp. LC1Hm]
MKGSVQLERATEQIRSRPTSPPWLALVSAAVTVPDDAPFWAASVVADGPLR